MLKKIAIAATLFVGYTASAQDIPPIRNIGDVNELIEKLRNNTIPQLRSIHQCYVDAKSIVDDYHGMKQVWVGKTRTANRQLLIDAPMDSVSTDFDLNIYRNFEGLGMYQKQFFEELRSFIRTYNVAVDGSLEGIQNQILKIDQGQIAFSSKLYEIARRDSLYLALLAHIKVEADREYSRLSLQVNDMIVNRCKNANLEPIAGFIEADVRSVIANIEKLRGFTLDSIDKRNLIVKRTYHEIRQKQVDKYQLLAGQELGKIGAEATDVLNLAKVGEEMLSWWTEANQNGLAKSLHLKYLQFETPRDLLLLEKLRASKFEESIRSFQNAPAQMSSYYLTRLFSFQKTIEENLKTLTERGWKGQLERQILLNTKRKSAASRLSTACVDSLQKHLESASTVKNLDQFRKTELLYALSLHTCQF